MHELSEQNLLTIMIRDRQIILAVLFFAPGDRFCPEIKINEAFPASTKKVPLAKT